MKFFIYILAYVIFSVNPTITKKKALKVGDKLPSFTLIDGYGKSFTSSDYFGKQPLVVFFYSKDNSPVCTTEVCSFRDSFEEFTKLNVKIVGISTDNAISHRKFSEKHNLPYMLLSDHSKRVVNLFGITKGRLKRTTYVTNKKGRIIYIYTNAKEGDKHAEEALNSLRVLLL